MPIARVYQQGVPATRDPGVHPPGQDPSAPVGVVRPPKSDICKSRGTIKIGGEIPTTSAGTKFGTVGEKARGTGVLGDPYFITGTGVYGEPEPIYVEATTNATNDIVREALQTAVPVEDDAFYMATESRLGSSLAVPHAEIPRKAPTRQRDSSAHLEAAMMAGYDV